VRHVYYCPLRWADMDSLGHVNNVTYVDYLQEARVDMLAVHAPETGGEALAEGVVVVRHEVEFVAPLVFRPEPVRIETWVSRIRAASITMRYEILDELPDGGRRVYTRASTVLTPFVFATERPRRVSQEEKDVLEGFYEADGEAKV
jgi:acyl-CoA thioester hydrolase